MVTALLFRHLIRLQHLTDQFIGQGMRIGHGWCMSQPINPPGSFRHLPVEETRHRINVCTYIQDLLHSHFGFLRQGHDRHIPIKGGSLTGRSPAIIDRQLRFLQFHRNSLTALNTCHARDQLLHAPFFGNPRSPGRRITGGIMQSDLQTQSFRFSSRMTHGLPIGRTSIGLFRPRAILHRSMRLLYGRGQMKDGSPTDPSLFHRLQIPGDTLLGKKATHPMPPDIGTIVHRWLLELPSQRLNRHRLSFRCDRFLGTGCPNQSDDPTPIDDPIPTHAPLYDYPYNCIASLLLLD